MLANENWGILSLLTSSSVVVCCRRFCCRRRLFPLATESIPAWLSQQMRRFTKIVVVQSGDGSGCGMECRHRRPAPSAASIVVLLLFDSVGLGWVGLGWVRSVAILSERKFEI